MDRILSIRHVCRRAASLYAVRQQKLHTSPKLLNTNDGSSSDSSDSDGEIRKPSKAPKNIQRRDEESKKQTIDLLNNLLATMIKQVEPKPMERAIPKRKPYPKRVPEPPIEEKLTAAAKEAATAIGGDVEKTQADLLGKIFSAPTPKPPPVASDGPKPSTLSLSELLGEMKIDRSVKPKELEPTSLSKSPRIQEAAERFKFIHERNQLRERTRTYGKLEPANLYGGNRLKIFESSIKPAEDTPKLETWEQLEQKELKLLLTHPPRNIFEEMIQWTEKGLLWQFPINNEFGMEAEESVHFSEHVFMERHLQGWCPQHGPIRHFMELVCVGLSKNNYMPVQEKIDHIMWYKDYFGGKQELLKEIGAITEDILKSNTPKQIEPK